MRKTILLVEDHDENRKVYATILRVAGFDVLEAADGRAAIRMAREARPDLVLMDISIPLIDGWTATRTLKAGADTSAIPVIALTGLDGAAERRMARAVGCAAFLAKPVDPARVVAEVNRLLVPLPEG